jgi:hypothetical protein
VSVLLFGFSEFGLSLYAHDLFCERFSNNCQGLRHTSARIRGVSRIGTVELQHPQFTLDIIDNI